MIFYALMSILCLFYDISTFQSFFMNFYDFMPSGSPERIHGVMVSAMDFYPGDRGSIPRQVEMFINLKYSFRMRLWESFHASGPTAPEVPHPLNVVCGS